MITTYVIMEKRISIIAVIIITSRTMLTSPINFIPLLAKGVMTTPDSIPIELAIP